MQLDENTANSVAVRPTALAPGAVRWFRERDLGGGITGTTMDADFLNDVLGNLIAVLAAGGVTRTKGAGGDDDLLDAIKVILGITAQQGTLHGHLKRTAAGIVQLQPVSGTDVAIGVNNLVMRNTGPITWDMASDLEGGESASTAYYLYARVLGGAIDPQISATPPDLQGGAKPGYKNGDISRRCVGSIWNKANQDFINCTWLPGGQVLFHEHDASHEHALLVTQITSWREVALNLPVSALSARINASGEWTSGAGMAVYAAEGASSVLSDASNDPSTDPEILAAHVVDGTSNKDGFGIQFDLPIITPAAPKLAYGLTEDLVNTHMALVLGYTDIFAPR